MLYVQGEEVRMTQCFGWPHLLFLLFEHILKLKLVDPKITQQLPVTCAGDFASELDGCLVEQRETPAV